MLDIKFVRENPEVVKQNIRNKFQDNKLELVDKVIELDKEHREIKQEVEALRAERNKTSKQIGALMAQGKKEEAEETKKKVAEFASRLSVLEEDEKLLEEKIMQIMLIIPNIIDPSVPIGKNDEDNVEITKYGEATVPDFEIPYHTEIMEKFDGIDLDSAVMIRFVEQEGEKMYFKSGGGITCQSDVESEYNEMKQKVYVPIY